MNKLNFNFWEELNSSPIILLLLSVSLLISCEVKDLEKRENEVINIEIDLDSFKEGKFSD